MVSSPDLYFNQPPSIVVSEVLAVHSAGHGVYTAAQNHNYTDGFYLGGPCDTAKVLWRFAEFRELEKLSQHEKRMDHATELPNICVRA